MTPAAIQSPDLVALPLLADPSGYVACPLDLSADAGHRRYWLGVFRRHFPTMMHEARLQAQIDGLDLADFDRRAEAATTAFMHQLDALQVHPETVGRLDILKVCYARQEVLDRFHFGDPYRLAKQRENQVALALLPQVFAEIDALPGAGPQRAERLARGAFAGNIFDLGATETVALFKDGPVDFRATLGKLKGRPWAVDDLDLWLTRLAGGPAHRCAVVFVDNAGPDVLLGMLPWVRQILLQGTRVILTANTLPALNDITHDELTSLLATIARWDKPLAQALSTGQLVLVPSGNGAPLIDLSRVSLQLAAAIEAAEPDLLILEGMGRAVESNFDARFTCDTIKVAMIKDPGVAEQLGCGMYDLVFRYEPAGC